MPITTTLNRIRSHRPCAEGWTTLLNGLGKTAADDEPLAYSKILEINGIDDALWCCRAEPQHAKKWRLFAVWCARQVQHLMKDQRSISAIDIAEKYANDLATYEELKDAYGEACSVAVCGAASFAVWTAARVSQIAKFKEIVS